MLPKQTNDRLFKPEDLPRLVVEHGNAVSAALLNPACSFFRAEGIPGVIGYRQAFGCAVALGDPVTSAEHQRALAAAFKDYCAERGWHSAYAAASEPFAEIAADLGYACIEVCKELILDPTRNPTAGSAGRELRKKVSHARREGVEVLEYKPPPGGDAALEEVMQGVASAWLAARSGPQIYLAPVLLFEPREGRRYFYAKHHDGIVGVLSLVHLRSQGGYLLEHLLPAPTAPSGTSEILVVGALEALRAEGCTMATFGPAPGPAIGKIKNLGKMSEAIARKVYDAAVRVFHLDSRTRYRQKFQAASALPSFVLLNPPRMGVREALGLARAFNVSLA